MEELKENIDMLKEELTKLDITKVTDQLGPLHRAVFSRDKVKLEELLRSGEDGDDEDGTQFNYTAAHWAAMMCNDEILDLLNNFGTNMSAVDKTDLRPLHVASLADNSAALIWLLENTFDIESTDIYDQTPLHQAALNGCLKAVKILVDHGASLEAIDEFGMTPICLAATRGFSPVVNFLLQKGANPAVRDIDGKTLLHASSAIGDAATIVRLAKIGLDVNAKDNKNCTPLHDAAKNGCSNAVSLLLQHGAFKNVTDLDGYTPLSRAKEAGYANCVALLMYEEKDATEHTQDHVEIPGCSEELIDSTTNGKDTPFNDCSQIELCTSSLPHTNDTPIENSDNPVTYDDCGAENEYCKDPSTCGDFNGNEISSDDNSGDEDMSNLQLDFSTLTSDDINKIIF